MSMIVAVDLPRVFTVLTATDFEWWRSTARAPSGRWCLPIRQVGGKIPAILTGTSRVRAASASRCNLMVGEEINTIRLSQMPTGDGFHKGNGVLDFFHDLSVPIGVG